MAIPSELSRLPAKAFEQNCFETQFHASEARGSACRLLQLSSPVQFLPLWYSRCDYEALFADGKLGSIVQHHLSFVQPVLTFTEQCGERAERSFRKIVLL
jgi:hypothetical protein